MMKKKLGARALGVLGVLLGGLVVSGLSGCNGGAEAIKPGTNPNPGAVPHGATIDEYRAGMQKAKQGAYGGPASPGGPVGGPAGGPGR